MECSVQGMIPCLRVCVRIVNRNAMQLSDIVNESKQHCLVLTLVEMHIQSSVQVGKGN